MKRKVTILALGFLLISSSVFAAGQPIKLMVNNEYLTTDVAPVIENQRTLAPVRSIFEALGLDVDWEPSTKTVTGSKDGMEIKLILNSNKALVNGKEYILDVPAKTIKNRTFVPVRFLGESLGKKVDFKSNTVLIDSELSEEKESPNYQIRTSDLEKYINQFYFDNLVKNYGKPNIIEYEDDYMIYSDFGDLSLGAYDTDVEKAGLGIFINKPMNLPKDFLKDIKVGDSYNTVLNKLNISDVKGNKDFSKYDVPLSNEEIQEAIHFIQNNFQRYNEDIDNHIDPSDSDSPKAYSSHYLYNADKIFINGEYFQDGYSIDYMFSSLYIINFSFLNDSLASINIIPILTL